MMEMDLSAGHVRIYNFNGSSWIQLGNDIDGEAASDIVATQYPFLLMATQ